MYNLENNVEKKIQIRSSKKTDGKVAGHIRQIFHIVGLQ